MAMLSILIVDDETYVCDGIIQNIPWHELGICWTQITLLGAKLFLCKTEWHQWTYQWHMLSLLRLCLCIVSHILQSCCFA